MGENLSEFNGLSETFYSDILLSIRQLGAKCSLLRNIFCVHIRTNLI